MNDIIKNFKDAKIGQLVRINDVDLLIALDDCKKLPDFLVKERRHYSDDLSEYVILTLDHIGTEYEYLLVCDIYKDVCDVNLYAEPQFFTPDKRSVLMESNNDWLFDFENYPEEIYQGDNQEIVFKQKVKTQLYGRTSIVEWITNEQIVDYKLLLIETGLFNEGGGWVEFYEGRQINEDDVIW